MVYFVIGGHYRSGNTAIIITSLEKKYITYMRAKGKVEHRTKVYWTRLKNLEHPVQYIKLDGKRIFALNIDDDPKRD